MICAQCAAPVDLGVDRCPSCQATALLDGRYRLDRVLDGTGGRTCYRGTRLDDRLEVHAACLPMPAGAQQNEDMLELGRLQHTFLPRWLDAFTASHRGQPSLWLIHAHTRGETLAKLIAAGEPFDEAAAHELLANIGTALAYLHALEPPIVHGGISPRSLQRRAIDARWALVEPPEVRRPADASPAGDLRYLGLALLAWLGVHREEAGWRDRLRQLSIDPDLAELIASMVDPHDDRLSDGRALCAELDRFLPVSEASRDPSAPPSPRASSRPKGATNEGEDDAPLRRPEELSRELSEAHKTISAFESRSKRRHEGARVLVIALAAVVAGLLTWALSIWVR